jgi:hypothetical protein
VARARSTTVAPSVNVESIACPRRLARSAFTVQPPLPATWALPAPAVRSSHASRMQPLHLGCLAHAPDRAVALSLGRRQRAAGTNLSSRGNRALRWGLHTPMRTANQIKSRGPTDMARCAGAQEGEGEEEGWESEGESGEEGGEEGEEEGEGEGEEAIDLCSD